MPTSLYQLWQQTVSGNPARVAVTDAAARRSYTFAELDAASAGVRATHFPSGTGLDFLLQTIAAWRDGLTICPQEPGAPQPQLAGLPAGIAHVKATSGSTGKPRLVLFTAEQLAADARNIVSTMGLSPQRPNIGVISMAHSYGFSNLVLPLLLHGVPLVLGGDPLPGSFARALTLLPEGGGCVPAVPAMWSAWHRAACLDPERIHLAISAGAPLALELERAIFDQHAIKVHNFYGSSECGGIAYDSSDIPRDDAAIAGTPLAGVDVALDNGGCLTVRGAAVGSGYWPRAETALAHGRFVTQDLAAIAPDGEVHLLGRCGDLINIAGRKLDPASIEEKLLEVPAVEFCIVFGVPSDDPQRVQEVVAIASGSSREALRTHLSHRLPAWQKVRHWWINPELKPDGRGKLSRERWRRAWQAQKSC